jgi:hypothetical protein
MKEVQSWLVYNPFGGKEYVSVENNSPRWAKKEAEDLVLEVWGIKTKPIIRKWIKVIVNDRKQIIKYL